MSAAGSSIPAALDAFKTLIGGLPALTGVTVVEGLPGPEMDRESVVIAPVVEIVDNWVHLGCRTREEQWTAHVFITVARPGDEVAAARDRAFEITDAIAEALKQSATTIGLNGQVLWSSFRRTSYALFVEGDGGAAAQIACDLAGTHRY